jgi:AcrR family transcriptional regulator
LPRRRSTRPKPSSESILGSAERLFGERGYAEPSLRELIAASGCSTTAFYARFPTKEAVLRTLVADLVDRLLAGAAEALPRATSLEDGFALGIGVLVEAVRDRRGLVRVALTAEEPETRALLHARYRAIAELLAASLPEGSTPDRGALGWALVGALELTVRRWAVFGELEDLAAALHATARALLPITAPERPSRRTRRP